MEIFRLPERLVITRLRHPVVMHDGQSILTVLSANIFCCPKNACFSFSRLCLIFLKLMSRNM